MNIIDIFKNNINTLYVKYLKDEEQIIEELWKLKNTNYESSLSVK